MPISGAGSEAMTAVIRAQIAVFPVLAAFVSFVRFFAARAKVVRIILVAISLSRGSFAASFHSPNDSGSGSPTSGSIVGRPGCFLPQIVELDQFGTVSVRQELLPDFEKVFAV